MTEFKVGDRVKADPSSIVYPDVKDLPGTVVEVVSYGSWPVKVEFDDYGILPYPCSTKELIKEEAPVVEKRQVTINSSFPSTQGKPLTVDAESETEVWLRYPDGTHCTFDKDQVTDYVPAPVEGEYWQYQHQYASKPSRIFEVTDSGWVVFGLEYEDEADQDSIVRNARKVSSFLERYKKVDG